MLDGRKRSEDQSDSLLRQTESNQLQKFYLQPEEQKSQVDRAKQTSIYNQEFIKRGIFRVLAGSNIVEANSIIFSEPGNIKSSIRAISQAGQDYIIYQKFIEFKNNSNGGQLEKHLVSLVKDIYMEQTIERTIIIKQLDQDFLETCGLIDQQNFSNKLRMLRTRNQYEQQKFNLMREENEGFSKLLVELNQINIKPKDVEIVKYNIQTLIGYFNLDPNRVLDIILDSFENNIWNGAYLHLLKDQYKSSSISQLLGFKFQNYLQQIVPVDKSQIDNPFQIIPQGLLLLTAVCLKFKLIELEEIWNHLNYEPNPNLIQTAKNGNQKQNDHDEIEILLNLQKEQLTYHYNMLFFSITNKEMYEAEVKKVQEQQLMIQQQRKEMLFNFKVWLCESLIRVNHWDLVEEIFGGIYGYRFDLTLNKWLMKAMHESLNWVIQPLYSQSSQSEQKIPLTLQMSVTSSLQRNYPQIVHISSPFLVYQDMSQIDQHPSLVQATTSEQFFSQVPKILRILHLYIAYDPMLYQKLCTLLKNLMNENKELSVSIAGEILLPALALSDCNNSMAFQLWDILKEVPGDVRYEYYTAFMTKTYLSNTTLLSKMIEVYEETNSWSRRLSIDTVHQNARQLAKLASGNALIIFDSIVTNAKYYRNMIEAQVQSLQYCTPLALDIMAYTILRQLSDSSQPLLDPQDASISQWLQNLAEFSSCFFKKHCHVDLEPLLCYLLNKLTTSTEGASEMIILKDVIARMFGWSQFSINEMSASQLQALAGGFCLRLELMAQSTQFKKTSRSGDALVNIFWEKTNEKPLSLAFRLMANLAKQTQYILLGYESNSLTLVSTLFDRLQFIFLQFVETLIYLENQPSKFAELLPKNNPSQVLSYDYNLPPHYVFFIMRGSLKPICQLTDEEFSQKVHEFKQILDYHFMKKEEVITQEMEEENEYWDEKMFIAKQKEDIWQCLSPELYTIFWYLSLQNLEVPSDIYDSQIKKIQSQIDELKQQRNDQSSSQKSKTQKEIERLRSLKGNLKTELEIQTKNKEETMERFLKVHLTHSLKKIGRNDYLKNVSSIFIQICMYPRILFSTPDAMYTIKFLQCLQQLKVTNFNMLNTIGQLLRGILPCLHCCTEKESENIGIFFMELLNLIKHWCNPDVFAQECQGYEGFAKLINSSESVTHEEFTKKISENIFKRIAQIVASCFANPKMQMKARNGLIVLNRMSSIFPNKNQIQIAKFLQEKLQKLVDLRGDIGDDLFILASRINETLKKKFNIASKVVVNQEAAAREKQSQRNQTRTVNMVQNDERPREITNSVQVEEEKKESRRGKKEEKSPSQNNNQKGGSKSNQENSNQEKGRKNQSSRSPSNNAGMISGKKRKGRGNDDDQDHRKIKRDNREEDKEQIKSSKKDREEDKQQQQQSQGQKDGAFRSEKQEKDGKVISKSHGEQRREITIRGTGGGQVRNIDMKEVREGRENNREYRGEERDNRKGEKDYRERSQRGVDDRNDFRNNRDRRDGGNNRDNRERREGGGGKYNSNNKQGRN